ncbi:hypothetical protein KIH77_09810 [Bifidobacterium sp. 82T24]|uniref:Spy0128 family protein n=1 Tax=Bifidobacterium pluvialisilvae TaxID=2834436 RepID=UPI001C589A99|nr:FctA domain-containing protein [Bifidobacterium pluvialisilvae]MBW3089013.1 hypothetical protein [Bifidobacterium pluvialisilvae]
MMPKHGKRASSVDNAWVGMVRRALVPVVAVLGVLFAGTVAMAAMGVNPIAMMSSAFDGGTAQVADAPAAETTAPSGIKARAAGRSFVGYDGTDAADSTVKVTVTLPEGAKTPAGTLKATFEHGSVTDYPNVYKYVGETNGEIQLMGISWRNGDDETWLDGIDGVDADHPATVQVEYLKDSAKLPGRPAERKLMVLVVVDSEVKSPEAVTDVQVGDDGYNGFTFQTDSGFYAFASKKVSQGYVKSAEITAMQDGTSEFDKDGDLKAGSVDAGGNTVAADAVDVPGSDSGRNNHVVRTFDTVKYTVGLNFGSRDTSVKLKTGKVWVETRLKADVTEAGFDTTQMLWMGNAYVVEYVNADGKVVLVRDSTGKYWKGGALDEVDGSAELDTNQNGSLSWHGATQTSVNAFASGSDKGTDSYTTKGSLGIVEQRIIGGMTVNAKDDEGGSFLNGNRDVSAAVQVLNAGNGTVVTPTFTAWLDGNEDNYGSEEQESGKHEPAPRVTSNTVTADVKSGRYAVVSAAASYNVQVKKNASTSYRSWFDFTTGQEVPHDSTLWKRLEELAAKPANKGKVDPARFEGATDAEKQEFGNIRWGRITGYGITLQVGNKSDGDSKDLAANKKLKGISLPAGTLSFDVNLSSQLDGKADGNYETYLWDYNENVDVRGSYWHTYEDGTKVEVKGDYKGHGDRNFYWGGEYRSAYANGAAPFNVPMGRKDANGNTMDAQNVYKGGSWTMTTAADSPTSHTADHSFKVSGYDFDFDNWHWPSKEAGWTPVTEAYLTHLFGFSSASLQVMNAYPRVATADNDSKTLRTIVNANDLTVTSHDGQQVKSDPKDPTRTHQEANTGDNVYTDAIQIYSPGHMSKGNSFNRRGAVSESDGYLGTQYWDTSYDSVAYANSDITMIGYYEMSPGADDHIRAANYLQLFDSRAITINGTPRMLFDDAGEHPAATILYAADPDHPDGYDTNKDGMVQYMNGVREEDLVYSKDAPDAQGYVVVNGEKLKCVGVLAENRNLDVFGGKFQRLQIPVHINGDDADLVNRTVATVNMVRVWYRDGAMTRDDGSSVSWADGKWDAAKGRNTLAGYQTITSSKDENENNGEDLNNRDGSKGYVKTEYQNGQLKEGTHKGGVFYGNSLLIVSYKASVVIGIDKANAPDNPSYDLTNGETQVDYRITGIKTEIGSDVTKPSTQLKTDLDINAGLDVKHTGDRARVTVQNGSFMTTGYQVGKDGRPEGDERQLAISADSQHPTTVGYYVKDAADPDGPGTFHTYTVYARVAADGRSVSFHIADAIVGMSLPDITFKANLAPNELDNNDIFTTQATISGSGDTRAYDEAKGNMSSIAAGIVKLSGATLVKSVDKTLVDQDRTVTYTVTYANTGDSAIGTMYMYDLLPYNGDIRASDFTGDVILRAVDAKVSGLTGTAAGTSIDAYYSTLPQDSLRSQVEGFGGRDATKVEALLGNTRYFNKLGTIDMDPNSSRYGDLIVDPGIKDPETTARKITAVYIRAKRLPAVSTLSLYLTAETGDNKAADMYGNVAHSWIAGGSAPIQSNMVSTVVVSREINGVAWYDRNANGVRDDGERTLGGVTATLFKKQADGSYRKLDNDIAGDPFSGNGSTTTTRADGAYDFLKVPEGDYIVAFQGDRLDDYMKATAYQSSAATDATNNDGVAVAELNASGITGYPYAIKYSAKSNDLAMYSPEDMAKQGITLDNYTQRYANKDLGLTNTGDLKIVKTVKRNDDAQLADAQRNQSFAFDVTLALDGKALAGTHAAETTSADGKPTEGDVTFDAQGKATVTLRHGQSITIKDLPTGASYSVAERRTDAYTSKLDNATGTIGKSTTVTANATNTYTPTPADFTPQVTKQATNGGNVADRTFTFSLAGKSFAHDDAVTGADGKAWNGDTATVRGLAGTGDTVSGTAKFGKLVFTKAGTYTFAITENGGNGDGWTIDDSTWTLTVKVKDAGDGTLAIDDASYTKDGAGQGDGDGQKPTSARFSNTYAAKGEVTLDGTKTLTGRDMAKGEFTFDVKDAKNTVVATGTNAAAKDGKPAAIAFPKIGYDTASLRKAVDDGIAQRQPDGSVTFAYTVSERADGLANTGVAQTGTTSFAVTVRVVDNGHGGLVATPTYPDGGIAFANTYTTKEKPVSVDDLFTKAIDGRDWLSGDSFEFHLKRVTKGAPMPAETNAVQKVDDDTVKTTVKSDSAKDGDKVKFGFGSITYDFDSIKDGTINAATGKRTKTFTYEVTEAKPRDGAIAGMTYSTNKATLTVTVTDNGDGTLSAGGSAVTVENGAFTNVYSTDARLNVALTNKLTGRDMVAGQYRFTADPQDVPAADGRAATTKDETAKKLGLGGADSYVSPAANSGEATGRVPVTDGDAAAAGSDPIVFTPKDAGRTYRFKLAESTYPTTEASDAGGNGYRNDRTARVVDITPSYDKTTGVLTVTATSTREGASAPDAAVTVKSDAAAGGDDTLVVPFANTYRASGDATIAATKTLTGRPLNADEFTFQVKDANGKVIATGRNAAAEDGKPAAIDFGRLAYDVDSLDAAVADHAATRTVDAKTGNATWTLRYTVAESTDGLADGSITPGAANFTVTATVTDQGDGSLKATIAYPQDSDGTLAFTNTYGTNEVPVTIAGTKQLDYGHDGLTTTWSDIKDGFDFTLTGVDAADSSKPAPLPAGAKDGKVMVKADDAGAIDFGAISYRQPQVMDGITPDANGVRTRSFVYTITESGKADGVTNDGAATRTVTVKLTEYTQAYDGHEAGALVAETTGDTVFRFRNTYDVQPVESSITDQLKVRKTLTGRNMTPGEFNFDMVEGDGDQAKVVATGSNDADGNVTFGKIRYEQPGEHDYTVRETTGDKGGVDYDHATYVVHASVVDNGDGTMSVTWTRIAAGDDTAKPSDGIAFANAYTPTGTSVTLGAMKHLEGRDLKAGEFTFALKSADGATLQTEANKADGSIGFKPISYTADDMADAKRGEDGLPSKTFAYTIEEVGGDVDHVTYDRTVHKVSVTVTDDLEGHLHATVAYDGKTADATPTFVNTYDEPEKPTPGEPGKPGEPERMARTGVDMGAMAFGVVMLAGLGVLLAWRRPWAGAPSDADRGR